MYRSASAEVLDIQPQSELLAGEIERHKNASVSRSFGQKMLFDALGARESSMVYAHKYTMKFNSTCTYHKVREYFVYRDDHDPIES